jgi:hypothetical protein
LITKNQKGFAALEAVLIALVVGVVAYAGYYIYSSQSKDEVNTSANNSADSTDTVDNVQDDSNDEDELKKDGSYSIDVDKSKYKEVAYADFKVNNASGDYALFNQQTKKFYMTGYDGTNAKDLTVHTTASDSTPIFLWVLGDAGLELNTYLIDLGNGKILQIEFSYLEATDDGLDDPREKPAAENAAQKLKDLAAVKTFKFL